MKYNSHLTAIARKTLPVPTQWLISNGFVKGKVLDYGCGRCKSVNLPDWDNYDPFFAPTLPSFKYDTIICNYVLCTLPPREHLDVLKKIQIYLNVGGNAFVSLRNDRPAHGWGFTKRGTYQGRVQGLPLTLVHKCAQFRTYLLTLDTSLV
jgi:hypothetical protein